MSDYKETFVPYNSRVDYVHVTFVELLKDGEGFSDIMVIEYEGNEYELLWDDYEARYEGEIVINNKAIDGYIL